MRANGAGVPRFYFHLFNDVDAHDHEGRDVADPAAARDAAKEDIRSIISDAARHGRLDLRGRIEIADERGVVIDAVSFGEAVELLIGEPS